jgi:hypothetical protein
MRWVLTCWIVACNAISGPDLTGGLLEATALADVLIGIVQRKVSDSGCREATAEARGGAERFLSEHCQIQCHRRICRECASQIRRPWARWTHF